MKTVDSSSIASRFLKSINNYFSLKYIVVPFYSLEDVYRFCGDNGMIRVFWKTLDLPMITAFLSHCNDALWEDVGLFYFFSRLTENNLFFLHFRSYLTWFRGGQWE